MKITNYIKMTVLTTALGSTTFADANVFDDARDMTIKANAYLNDNGRDVALLQNKVKQKMLSFFFKGYKENYFYIFCFIYITIYF